MTNRHPTYQPFRLGRPRRGRARRAISFVVNPAIERALAFNRLNAIYDRVGEIDDPDASFSEKVLEAMAIRVAAPSEELKRLPTEGPLMVVSNHPFGAVDGIILMSLLGRVREDSKTMANFLLGRIPELRQSLIMVDPFAGKQSTSRNIGPLKESIRWLKEGHCLGMFPAGEVAHLKLHNRGIVDPPWTDMLGRLARKTNATVVPVYFHGTNSPLFHLMGLIHPRLRTLLLPRELLRREHSTITVRIGRPIRPERIKRFDSDAAVTTYCRMRSDLLAIGDPKRKPAPQPKQQPIADPVDPADIEREIAALPPDAKVVDTDDQVAYIADAGAIPNTLREIGRQREIAFRQVGEGTGRPFDLDRFDRLYLHLFIWHPQTRQVIGGYRLGQTDKLVARYGLRGLYTRTLFAFGWKLLKQIDPALEVGRSFVHPDFQRSYAPLMNLWKGLAAFCYRNPRYVRLIGPVSISNDYHDESRRLLIEFLRAHNLAPQLAKLCRARNPMRKPKRKNARFVKLPAVVIDDIKEVGDLIDDIEQTPRGVPILIKQYLRLGARFLGCNLDPDFGDALDAFVLIDLRQTDPRILGKYMGDKEVRAFRKHHGLDTP